MDDLLSQILLPYQRNWIADRSQIKIIEKSRRIGLSWADALESCLTAAAKPENGGSDCWYIGYNKDMSETYIEDVARWAKELNVQCDKQIVKDEDKDILVFRVRFASGHKVSALSSKATNLRGKKGRVILDEFAFHDNPDELLKAAIALQIWGGNLAIISTHNGEGSLFNEIIKEIRAGRKPKWSLHRSTFDEAVADGLGKRIASLTGVQWSPQWEKEWRDDTFSKYGVMADEELLCIPGSFGGNRAFNHFSQDLHVGKCGFEYRWPLHISFDFNRHPATASIGQLRHDENGKDHLYVIEEIYLLHADTFKLGAAAREAIERYKPYVTFVHGDATGRIMTANSQESNWDIIRRELQGLPLNWRVKESNKSVKTTLNDCNNAFKQRLITVDPSCVELIKDLNTVRLVERPDNKVELDKKTDIMRSQVSDGFRYMVTDVMPYRGGTLIEDHMMTTDPLPINAETFGLPARDKHDRRNPIAEFRKARQRDIKRRVPRFG